MLGDYDYDESWEAAHWLRRIGTREVFDEAAKWTESAEPLVRARGLDVIAQLGKTPEHSRIASRKNPYDAVVAKVVQQERELQPLNSVISALGHIGDPRAVPLIAVFHPNPSGPAARAVAG